MPTRVQETSTEKDPLLTYKHLGLDLRLAGTQGLGECINCGKEKWYVSAETGKYECKSCMEKGNIYQWMTKLWELSYGATKAENLQLLAKQRSLLFVDSLRKWGVCKSILTDEWLIPGYNAEGKLTNLYRYTTMKDSKTRKSYKTLIGATGLNAAMFGVDSALKVKDANTVWVTEGPWDGMVLEETGTRCKEGNDGGLSLTASAGMSVLGKSMVIAVPGAGTFNPAWSTLLSGRKVVLCYDNDHPRLNEQTGKEIQGAAVLGLKRVVGILAQQSSPPESVSYLQWGPIHDQANDERKSGFDLRDWFLMGNTLKERFALLARLINGHVTTIPQEWVQGGMVKGKLGKHTGSVMLEPLECTSWKELRTAWQKAMKWTPGLERALSIMLCVASGVMVVGEQLWFKVVSPPSGGKSTLCEAISVAREYVLPKDTFSGLASGYQVDREGSENLSIVLKINGKTLAIKDADTILQHPNKAQILSQFRALYDRAFRTSYNNKMSLDHDNINTGVILCGTSSLRALDDSELGQRFLDCEIMATIDQDLEDAINVRSLNHYRELMKKSPLVNGEGADSPERILAKRLTGGYLLHLRNTIEDKIQELEVSDEALDRCNQFGKFVAYFRSRPSGRQTEEVHRELSTRLVLQHCKLAYCLAVVLGKNVIDDDVLAKVRQVCLDTARGKTLEIARMIYLLPEIGCGLKPVVSLLGDTEEYARKLLSFLRRINVVERFKHTMSSGQDSYRWRLSPQVQELWGSIMDPTGENLANNARD